MYRVLVVDDDEDIRTIVSRVLVEMGFQVEAVASAKAALASFESTGFDLVMTDIRMDGMDGLSLTAAIRDRNPDVPTIVMTGHASMDTAIAAIRAGACDYLVKPFENYEKVRATIKRALATTNSVREREQLIDALNESNRELHHLAIRDGLTGIYNRRHLLELLSAEFERAIRYRRELSIMFIDVDYFKEYNDRHGHPSGDEALQCIARVLVKNTRQSDAVGRWGGEEFVIVVPETTEQAASALAEKLRASVADFEFPGRETQPGGCVSISIGVATITADDSQAALIERADKALYAAKSAGRNTVKNAA
ncbi:MAG: diguanylate cyclase [Gammaproteobacteria bacterium]|nr:diguanylate cyclase [Gammaproteobacteria bacterium]